MLIARRCHAAHEHVLLLRPAVLLPFFPTTYPAPPSSIPLPDTTHTRTHTAKISRQLVRHAIDPSAASLCLRLALSCVCVCWRVYGHSPWERVALFSPLAPSVCALPPPFPSPSAISLDTSHPSLWRDTKRKRLQACVCVRVRSFWGKGVVGLFVVTVVCLPCFLFRVHLAQGRRREVGANTP